jgi:molybdopterin-biosynthesis enzyme MoeA-like protein
MNEARTIGLLVTGAEQLSGKRQDKHLAKVIELLTARGLELSWAGYVSDGEEQIAEWISGALRRNDVLLCSGGIGATPDDNTRQAAARAFGVPIVRHAQAEALIIKQYGEKALPHRVLMADFPLGAGLIPNPVNNVAGFFLGDCHFVPGFPEMAWPMFEWVLDQRYAHLHRSDPPVEYRLRALGSSAEADLLPLMEELLRRYPGVRLSSLPSRGDAQRPRHIEFGIKGLRATAAPAFAWLRAQLQGMTGLQIEDIVTP